MDSPDFRELLPRITRLQKVVWWFINPLHICYLLPFYVGDQSPDPIEGVNTREALIYLFSFVCAGGAYVYRQWALAPHRLRQILATDVTPDMLRTAFGGVEDELVSQVKALPQEEQRQIYLVKKIEGVMIVSLFMHEVVAGSGVSLANDLPSVIPFLIATVALNLFVYPKPEQVLEQLQTQQYQSMHETPEAFSQQLDRLLAHWRRFGVPPRNGASAESIAAFEKKYEVSLPLHLQEYFLKADGMEGDGGGIADSDYAIHFCPLAEVRLASEIKDSAPNVQPYGHCYVFADYLLWSHGYAIRLAGVGAGEVVLVGGPTPRTVAGSFEEFVVKYLDSPQDLF